MSSEVSNAILVKLRMVSAFSVKLVKFDLIPVSMDKQSGVWSPWVCWV